MEKIITCLNRGKLGKCEKCTPDYNPNHHPNNLDCKDYSPMTLRTFYVKEKKSK